MITFLMTNITIMNTIVRKMYDTFEKSLNICTKRFSKTKRNKKSSKERMKERSLVFREKKGVPDI